MATRVTGRGLFWVTTGLAVAALVLVVINAGLTLSNRSAQTEINQRQQYINQNLQASRVLEALVRALATASVNNKDEALRQLLTQHGITFTVTPSQPGPSPQ